MMILEIEYEIEEIVYLKTDTESIPYMVVGYIVELKSTTYILQSAIQGQYNAREIEITRDKNNPLTMS